MWSTAAGPRSNRTSTPATSISHYPSPGGRAPGWLPRVSAKERMDRMIRYKLLLISAMAQHANSAFDRLEEAGFELVEGYHLAASASPDELAQSLHGIWGTVAGSEPYTREVLQQATSLRVIARCGVGYDAIDVDA